MQFNLNNFLILAFLFYSGSLSGWILEVVYRRFFSRNNPDKKWINPGFLIGPYIPLYGLSLVVEYTFAWIPVNYINNPVIKKIVLFALMAMAVTTMEYIAGIIFIRGMHIKLWDYSQEFGNIKGIICPKFSMYWMVLSGIYYFLIHPHVIESLYWLSEHLAFSFFIGLFYGVFIIDLAYSLKLLVKIRKLARENQVDLRIEELKNYLIRKNETLKLRVSFMLPLRPTNHDIAEDIREFILEHIDIPH